MNKFFSGKAMVLLGLVIIALYGFTQYFFPDKALDQLHPRERLALKKNILVMGVDKRAGDTGRGDTLFVVMFDSITKKASLLSIPRDTRVYIADYGWDKINHAYAYGGQPLTQKTVEELLGIRIDNYALLDLQSFQDLVDTIGGIDLNVEKSMHYRDAYDGYTINLQAGPQHLDGRAALQYVRYRDETGDIGRIGRQQRFIMAVYDRIASGGLLLENPRLPKQLMNMVKTDLALGEMLDLGKALHIMVRSESLKVATLPGQPKYIKEVSYWLPDITDLRSQMAQMQGGNMSEAYTAAAEKLEAVYTQEAH